MKAIAKNWKDFKQKGKLFQKPMNAVINETKIKDNKVSQKTRKTQTKPADSRKRATVDGLDEHRDCSRKKEIENDKIFS